MKWNKQLGIEGENSNIIERTQRWATLGCRIYQIHVCVCVINRHCYSTQLHRYKGRGLSSGRNLPTHKRCSFSTEYIRQYPVQLIVFQPVSLSLG